MRLDESHGRNKFKRKHDFVASRVFVVHIVVFEKLLQTH